MFLLQVYDYCRIYSEIPVCKKIQGRTAPLSVILYRVHTVFFVKKIVVYLIQLCFSFFEESFGRLRE